MPEMTPERRGSGPSLTCGVTVGHRGTHYTDDDLGRRCATCGLPMVRALDHEGFDTHPTCPDPDNTCRACAGLTLDSRWHDAGCPKRRKGRRRRAGGR